MDRPDTPDTADTLDTPDTLDTLDLAKLDRECQGPWEAEYSYGEEVDLHRHYANCAKNPGHKNFIPVERFSIEDLPERYSDNDIVDYIRAVSDLTVRVTVKYVSENRPKTVGVSEKPYLGYHCRGQRRITVGTGSVYNVFIRDDEMGDTCRCYDCWKSSTPQTKFAMIYINTVVHVVFDESEARHTTCHMFFDREGIPETCKGVVALTGMRFLLKMTESDFCEIVHYTHDLQLAQRLKKRCQEKNNLQDNIRTKLPKVSFFKYSPPTLDKQPLLIIVSHPHGCSKQISIGRWTSSHDHPNKWCSCTYNTATCPGSSGAPVCLPLASEPQGKVKLINIYLSHVGVFDKQPGMNFSNLLPGLQDFPCYSLQQNTGPWEEKFACGEEEDLQKHYDTCQKNPGHDNFFPVDKFSMYNLPPCYRKQEIMEMIKCVSGLTVRVSVKYVSEKRPATVPGTDIPYPWHINRGSNRLRVESGWVTEVKCFNNDACECEECKSSDTPKIGYAHVYVITAAHFICDELEAKHTICHLFYDSGETPDACKGVVALRNMCYMKTCDNTCKLMSKTHDLDLAGKLQDFNRDHVKFMLSWGLHYDRMYRIQNGTTNKTLAPRLDIVVSHPHGRAKRISIGYYGSHGNTGTKDNQCLYNSITCPGSSGTPVIMLGRTCVYPCTE